VLGCFALLPLAFATFPEVASPPVAQDSQLNFELHQLLDRLNVTSQVKSQHVAVSLVDLTDEASPRYAGINDQVMMYAASTPKIAILLAAFEEIRAGRLAYTPAVRDTFTRMTRYSSNVDASKAAHWVGFEKIAQTLTSSKYRLYDTTKNGGLWLGKAYGGPRDFWRADPLHNLSHGATTLQLARFFTLLAENKLVDPEHNRLMKEVLSKPGINHKFVKGLSGIQGVTIYRKSGTWRDWHSDAALIEWNGHRYVLAALTEDRDGGKLLEKLAAGVHQIISRRSPGW
jgi:beta-lactamase class A